MVTSDLPANVIQILAGEHTYETRPRDAALENVTRWIRALQGTGRPQLNGVVNELVLLRRQIESNNINYSTLQTLRMRTHTAISAADDKHAAVLQEIIKLISPNN